MMMTPLGLGAFTCVLLLVLYTALSLDRAAGFPELLPALPGLIVGIVLIAPGAFLCMWCIVRFLRARGTPVPFNPPRELVTTGLYGVSRNPMLTGLFACMFGVGFILSSLSIVFIFTPLFIILSIIELKLIEEPELERRFGSRYIEYKKRVPMFLPRVLSRKIRA